MVLNFGKFGKLHFDSPRFKPAKFVLHVKKIAYDLELEVVVTHSY